MSKTIQMGERFGLLTAIAKAEPYVSPNNHKTTQYLCRCECGNERIVVGSSLTGGATTSCGCTKVNSNIIGRKFGELMVVKEIEPFVYKSGIKDRQYLCRCCCGNEKPLKRNYLLSGYATNCGCRRKNKGFNIGDKYGRLTIIQRAKNDNRNQTRVVCQCECGKVVTVRLIHLKSGMTKSCGCLITDTNSTHQKSTTRLYAIWTGMKQRCLNPNSDSYKDYGGRGIKICDEWKNDFKAFYDWAMAKGYQDNLSIDRINNDGNYEPSNCRWATAKQQAENKRPTSKGRFEMDGTIKSLKEWCKFYGTTPSLVYGRTQRGWDKVRAITTPIADRYRRKRR